MASIIQKFKTGVKHLGPEAPHPAAASFNRGPLGFALNKSIRYGSALGLGFLKGAYREKMLWGPLPAEAWLGIGATGAAALLSIFTGGSSKIAPSVDAVGDTAMVMWLGSKGNVWGHKFSGRKVLVSGPNAPAAIPAGYTTVGELPQADPGRYLKPDEVMQWTKPRV